MRTAATFKYEIYVKIISNAFLIGNLLSFLFNFKLNLQNNNVKTVIMKDKKHLNNL